MIEAVPQHPAFTSLAAEATVWRYMDDFKFRWLVQERRLWMTRLPDLPDGLEGTVPGGEADWWEAKARAADADAQRSIYLNNRDFYQRFVRGARESWFVNCWTIREAEEPRMWTEYTSSPRSITARTTFGRLKAALPDFVHLGTVSYLDYDKERIEELNMYHRVMSKHKPDYEWERELRAFADLAGPDHAPWVKEARACCFEKEGDLSVKIVAPEIDLTLLFSNIVLHPAASPEYRRELVQFCADASAPTPEASKLTV